MKRIFGILVLCFLSVSCSLKNERATLPHQEKVTEKKQDLKKEDLKLEVAKQEEKSHESASAAVQDANIQNQVSPIIIGNVISENQSSLAFLNSGTIEKIYVRAGEHVKEGHILASLVSTQEAVEMNAAEIKVKQKKLAMDLEKKRLDRVTAQYNAGIVNKATLETEKNAFDSSQLELDVAMNELEGKKYNFKMTKIAAPYDGVISQKNKSVGDFVPAGTIVFQITQNKNMEIYAQIPGIYFNKLKQNMILNIVSSTNKTEVGTIEIRKVVPVLDKNSRTFDLYAKVINFSGQLNPGDFVEIRL